MTKKHAFVFPGQGSQIPGMGFSLASRFEDFSEIYESYLQQATDSLGFDLKKIVTEGPEEELRKTEITQPALLTLSVAMAKWLENHHIKAEIALGHSLGEYSALVYANSLEFSDAVSLVYKRGKLMEEAVPKGKGGMAALIGVSREEADQICKKLSREGHILEPSVINSAGQVVVSGHLEAIEELLKKAEDFGVRKVAPLQVSGPFHSSLLQGAGEKLREELNQIEIRRPRIRVVSNVTALPEFDPLEIKENLVKQVYKTVLWEDGVRFVGDEEIHEFVEVGPGKVLTGLIRKTLPDVKVIPLDGIQKLELLAA